MVTITNWRDCPKRQFNDVATVWSDLIVDEGFNAGAGIGEYGPLPEGKTPEELAKPDPNFELYFVFNGSGFLYAEGEGSRPITVGDAFALPPVPHFVYSASDEPLQIYYVALEGSGDAWRAQQ